MFLIRDIAPADLDGLEKTAGYLDTVNLPDDRLALSEIIARAHVASGSRDLAASIPSPRRRHRGP